MATNSNSNLFYPLVDSAFKFIKAVNSQIHKLPSVLEYPISDKINLGNIYIPIGRNKYGVQYLNIKGEQSHTYIVGQTGSGKSNLVKVILSTIVNNYPNVQLVLLDYKRVELSLFKNTKNCINFQWESEAIDHALEEMYRLVLARYDELEAMGKTKAEVHEMNPILVVIEELSLMPKGSQRVLRRIMAISRAINIHVLFVTQRPSNDILDNVCKSLVGNRICLKTEDIKNSLIASDTELCANLRGQGHGIIKSDGTLFEFQSYHINDNMVKMICDKHRKPTQPHIEKPTTNQPIAENINWINDL